MPQPFSQSSAQQFEELKTRLPNAKNDQERTDLFAQMLDLASFDSATKRPSSTTHTSSVSIQDQLRRLNSGELELSSLAQAMGVVDTANPWLAYHPAARQTVKAWLYDHGGSRNAIRSEVLSTAIKYAADAEGIASLRTANAKAMPKSKPKSSPLKNLTNSLNLRTDGFVMPTVDNPEGRALPRSRGEQFRGKRDGAQTAEPPVSKSRYQAFQQATQPLVDQGFWTPQQRAAMRFAAPVESGLSPMDRLGGLWEALTSRNHESYAATAEMVNRGVELSLANPRSVSVGDDPWGFWRHISGKGTDPWKGEVDRKTLQNLNPLGGIGLLTTLTQPSEYRPRNPNAIQWKDERTANLAAWTDALLGEGTAERIAKGDPHALADLAAFAQAGLYGEAIGSGWDALGIRVTGPRAGFAADAMPKIGKPPSLGAERVNDSDLLSSLRGRNGSYGTIRSTKGSGKQAWLDLIEQERQYGTLFQNDAVHQGAIEFIDSIPDDLLPWLKGEIADRLYVRGKPALGSYNLATGVAALLRDLGTSARASDIVNVLIHEVSHYLQHFVDDADFTKLQKQFDSERNAHLKQLQRNGLDKPAYQYSNMAEWWAHKITTRESFNRFGKGELSAVDSLRGAQAKTHMLAMRLAEGLRKFYLRQHALDTANLIYESILRQERKYDSSGKNAVKMIGYEGPKNSTRPKPERRPQDRSRMIE